MQPCFHTLSPLLMCQAGKPALWLHVVQDICRYHICCLTAKEKKSHSFSKNHLKDIDYKLDIYR